MPVPRVTAISVRPTTTTTTTTTADPPEPPVVVTTTARPVVARTTTVEPTPLPRPDPTVIALEGLPCGDEGAPGVDPTGRDLTCAPGTRGRLRWVEP
ncbi:hypothetical protein GCM10022243_51790 [Saccharothrix violaceirubra]